MTKPQGKRHVVVCTPEQALLIDLWNDKDYLVNSGKTYTRLYKYLSEHRLIDTEGNTYKYIVM